MSKSFLVAATLVAINIPSASLAEVSVLVGLEKKSLQKLFTASYAGPITKHFAWVGTGGFYSQQNFLSTPVGLAELGIKAHIEANGFYLSFTQGIGVISKKDKQLGDYLQLPTTVGAGLISERFHMGFAYKHLSSGRSGPFNTGKNFYCLDLGGSF